MTRISDILIEWYAREGRDLPWRRTRDQMCIRDSRKCGFNEAETTVFACKTDME